MKEYKNFFIKTLIIFLASIVILPLAIITIGGHFIAKNVYSKGAAHVNYWIETKNNHAKELNKKGNKIVFLSGSNTLHGLNSKYATELTGLPILNYGVHADFGTYIFEKVKDILKDGDIVVMPLEYNYFAEDSDSALPSPFAEYIISYDKSYYDKAPVMRKIGLVSFMAQYYIAHPKTIHEMQLVSDEYKTQLNEYGDFIGHNGTTENFSEHAKYMTITENIPKKYNKFALYKFIQYCKKHDIAIYATLPNMYHSKDYTADEMKAFENIKNFYEEQGVFFIGDITSGSYDDRLLFNDTGYHTNEKGTELRTNWFIDNILSLDEVKNGINYET